MKSHHSLSEEFIIISALLVITFGLLNFSGELTGFVIQEFTFTDDVGLVVTTSGNYSWKPAEEGVLTHLDISGALVNNGTAKVWLLHKNGKYLVYDSEREEEVPQPRGSGIPAITGLVTGGFGNETNETAPIEINETDNNTLPEVQVQNISQNNETNESSFIEISLTNNSSLNESVLFTNQTPSLNQSNGSVEEVLFNTTEENKTEEEAEPLNKTILLNLAYGDDPRYDRDNDGLETIRGVVDLSLHPEFNWDVDESHLCTRWRVFSEDNTRITYFCNGEESCCAFFDLLPSDLSWNASYYSTINKNGETENNLLSAQIVYYDVNLSEDLEHLSADISYSDWGYRNVKFSRGERLFSKECVDTCSLPNLGEEYTLLFELEGEVTLELDRIGYVVEREINTQPILLKNFDNISLAQGETYVLNLSEYFFDKDGDELSFSHYKNDLTISITQDVATITVSPNISRKQFLFFTANDSESMKVSNIFSIEIVERSFTGEEQVFAKVGEPVKWRKTIGKNGTVTLPAHALNFSVQKIVEGHRIKLNNNKLHVIQEGKRKKLRDFLREQEGRNIGKAFSSFQTKGQRRLQNRLAQLNVPTRTLQDSQTPLEVFVNESGEVEVEYFTEPPILKELSSTPTLKDVVISSDVHYVNITSFTSIPETKQEFIKLYRTTNGSRELTLITSYNDTNNNGLVDYIEWIVPHLSNQTYQIIIEITKAVHLDENKTFVADIYDSVKSLDANWSEPIYANEYVRVTFEIPLDASRDITIYARNNESSNTKVEVYHFNSSIKITEFPVITEEKYYKTFLTGMNGSHDIFDLKVVNEDNLSSLLEFDHIIDPNPTFTDITSGSGLATGTADESFVLFDCNNDGFIDVYKNGPTGSESSLRVNDRDGTFTNRDAQIEENTPSRGVSAGDIDNDGWEEIATATSNNMTMLENNQDPDCVFTLNKNLTIANAESVIFMDINNDSFLDVLYLSDTGSGSTWLDNVGNGTDFTQQDILPGAASVDENGEGSSAADFTNDGFVDIVYNDNEAAPSVNLWVSDGDYTYTLITTGTDYGFPSSIDDHESHADFVWGDCDNDGDLDFFMAGNTGKGLYLNNGSGGFNLSDNLTSALAAANAGADWADYDNDGDLDLIVVVDGGTSQLWNNQNGSCGFAETAVQAGVDDLDGTNAGDHVGWLDVDNDGDMDLMTGEGQLFRNNLDNDDFLKVLATGLGNTSSGNFSSKSAIGAQIRVYNDSGQLMGHREVYGSFNSYQPPKIQHFGVEPDKTYKINVRFPSGIEVNYSGCVPNQLNHTWAGNNVTNQTVQVNETATSQDIGNCGDPTPTLTATLSTPLNASTIPSNTTFVLQVNITCTGSGTCGLVEGLARYNSSGIVPIKSIPTAKRATPLHTVDINPINFQQEWSYHYDSGGNDRPYGVAFDSNSSVIIVGQIGNDWNVTKVDADGVQLWSYNYSSGQVADIARDVTTDSQDNIIVIGEVNGLSDGNITKLDPSGNQLWSFYHDALLGGARGVAVNSQDDVIVGMQGSGWNITRLNSDGDYIASIATGSGYHIYSVAIDSQDNIIVGGDGGSILNGEWNVTKYDSSLNHLWSEESGEAADLRVHDVAVDSADNVIVVGNRPEGGNITKLDSDGNYLWSQNPSTAIPQSVAIDSHDNIIVGILVASNILNVTKLNSSGSQLWSYRFDKTGTQGAEAVAVDHLDDIAVAVLDDQDWNVTKILHGDNRLSCGVMNAGDSCILNFTVNATGPLNTQILMDVNVSSNVSASTDTKDHLITITTPSLSVLLNSPANNSALAETYNVLSTTVTDTDNDNVDVYIWGANSTSALEHGNSSLLKIVKGASGTSSGFTTTYNWSAQVVEPDANTVLLLHFDNRTEYGENDSTVYDFSGSRNNATCPNATFCPFLNHSGGKFGGSVDFRIFEGLNEFRNSQYLEVNDSPTLDITSDLTIHAWIKLESFPTKNSKSRIITKSRVNGTPGNENASLKSDLTFYGRETGDRLGRAVASGDLNNDGIQDLVIGAYQAVNIEGPGSDEGETYIIYGPLNTSENINISDRANLTYYGGETIDQSGVAVAAGDLNNDGVDDLVIAAYLAENQDSGSEQEGEIYVYYGPLNATGNFNATAFANVTHYGGAGFDRAGGAVGAGDLNNDGMDDLVIGAYQAENAEGASGNNEGETYIIYGPLNATGNYDVTQQANLTYYGAEADDRFGRGIGLGDFNNDGITDLTAGSYTAENDQAAGTDEGEVYVLYGPLNLSGNLNASREANITYYGGEASDQIGRGQASADLNNDGIDDLIIGAFAAENPEGAGNTEGETYIIYGPLNKTGILNATKESNFTLYGGEASDNSGTAVGAGDLDNDGVDDLLIGAYLAENPSGGNNEEGETNIIYGPLQFQSNYDVFVDSNASVVFSFMENTSVKTSGSIITTQKYSSVTAVADSSSNLMSIYVDGTLQATTPLHGSATNYNMSVTIGSFLNGRGSPLNGSIDELVVWNTALSATEVLDLNRLKVGTWYWKVNTTDSKGNTAENKTFQFSSSNSPTILLNEPLNNTKTTNRHALLNSTVTDQENDVVDIFLWGANTTGQLDEGNNSLLAIFKGVSGTSGGHNFTFNWTTPVIQPNLDMMLLMHFDNRSEHGEDNNVVYDFTGLGNNATCQGGTCPISNLSAGKFAGSFMFDGIDDYLVVNDSPLLDINDSLTIHAWVKLNQLPRSKARIITKSVVNGTPGNENASLKSDLTFYGRETGDRLGRAVAAADLNNDGIQDLIIGAYQAVNIEGPGSDEGETYIIYGPLNTSENINISDRANLTYYGGEQTDQSGVAVGTGDLNNDGIDDLIIGAYLAENQDSGVDQEGEIYIYYGPLNATGNFNATALANVTYYGGAGFDRAGGAVGAGDLNNDGMDDLVIGAYQAENAEGPTGSNEGEVYVIYGPINLSGNYDVVQGANLTYYGGETLDRLGRGIGFGDLNNDGITDLTAGSYTAENVEGPGLDEGEVYVFYGPLNLTGNFNVSIYANLTYYGGNTSDQIGRGQGFGDLNNDGIDDLIIGAFPAENPEGPVHTEGEVYVIFGPLNKTGVLNATKESNFTFYGGEADDILGSAVGAGDLDNDGVDDLIIGAYLAENPSGGNNEEGETFIFYGPLHVRENYDLLITKNGSIQFSVMGNNSFKTPGSAILPGEYYSVAATVDGTNDVASIYINGMLNTSRAIHGIADNLNTSLFIGSFVEGVGSNLNGTLDELAIWNRSLSAAEVLDLQRLQKGVWYWKVNATDSLATAENKTFQFEIVDPPNVICDGGNYTDTCWINRTHYLNDSFPILNANNLIINGSGRLLNHSHGNNEGEHAISFFINLSGNLTIDEGGVIGLNGTSCGGGTCVEGGNLTIVAQNVIVNGHISVDGGFKTGSGDDLGKGGIINITATSLFIGSTGLISASSDYIVSTTNPTNGGDGGTIIVNTTLFNNTGNIRAQGGNGETDSCSSSSGRRGNGGTVNITTSEVSNTGFINVERGSLGFCHESNYHNDGVDGTIMINGTNSPCNNGTVFSDHCIISKGIRVTPNAIVDFHGKNYTLGAGARLNSDGEECSFGTCDSARDFTLINIDILNLSGGNITSLGGGHDTTVTKTGDGGIITINATTIYIGPSSSIKVNSDTRSSGVTHAGGRAGSVVLNATIINNTGRIEAIGGGGDNNDCAVTGDNGRNGDGGNVTLTAVTVSNTGFIDVQHGTYGDCGNDAKDGSIIVNGSDSPCNNGTVFADTCVITEGIKVSNGGVVDLRGKTYTLEGDAHLSGDGRACSSTSEPCEFGSSFTLLVDVLNISGGKVSSDGGWAAFNNDGMKAGDGGNITINATTIFMNASSIISTSSNYFQDSTARFDGGDAGTLIINVSSITSNGSILSMGGTADSDDCVSSNSKGHRGNGGTIIIKAINANLNIVNVSGGGVGACNDGEGGLAFINASSTLNISTISGMAENVAANVTLKGHDILIRESVNLDSDEAGGNGTLTIQYNNTINFTLASFISNPLLIKENEFGRIEFTEQLNRTDFNINASINISTNSISVDATNFDNALNMSAQLRITGLSSSSVQVTKDGVACPSNFCKGLVYNQGTGIATFNVTGWTEYSTQDEFAPSVLLNAPANDSLLEDVNVTLNATAIDANNDNLDIYFWGANTTTQLHAGNNSLLAVFKGVSGTSGGYNVTYNWTANPVQQDDSLVLLLHFDNQTAFNENNSYFFDYSHNATNGTCWDTSCPVYNYSDQILAGYLEFDGSNDNVTIPDRGTDFDALTGKQMTVAFWIKDESVGTNREILGKASGVNTEWSVAWDSGVAGQIEGCLNNVCATSGSTIDDGLWHHIAFRMDDVADEISLFIDGTKQADTEVYTGQSDNSNPFVIGDTGNRAGGTVMTSSIDEVAIWTRALTDSEIDELRKLRNGTLYWKVNATDVNGNSGENRTYQFDFNPPPTPPFSENPNMTFLIDQDGVITSYNVTPATFNSTFYNQSINATQIIKELSNGTYLSQVFDLGSNKEFLNISWTEGAPYGREIGKADGKDGNTPSFGGINTSGLIALLRFNNETEENDSLVKDFSVEMNNERAGENQSNATCFGTACPIYNFTNTVFGTSNVEFDGVDDRLTISSHAKLNSTNGTWSFWFYSNGTWGVDGGSGGGSGQGTAIMAGRHRSSSSFEGTHIVIYPAFQVQANNKDDSGEVSSVQKRNLNFSEWHHLVFTYSKQLGGRNELYIDGILVDNASNSAPWEYRELDVVIGDSDNTFWEEFRGQIEEFTLWNRTLTAEEARKLYLRGAARLNISVTSCDDTSCDGESFTTTATNSTKSDISSLSNNRYFQYKVNFETDLHTPSTFSNNLSPELFNVTIHYDAFSPPSILLNAPVNNSVTAFNNVTLNVTVTDSENQNVDIYIWGANSTEQLEAGNNSLLAIYKGVSGTSGGYNITYNWTAAPVQQDESLVLLLHFDNQTAFNENNSYFFDYSHNATNGTCWDTSCPVYNYSDQILGGYLEFDGSNDNITVPDRGTDFDALTGKQMTVAFWIKDESVGTTEEIMGKASDSIAEWYVSWNDGSAGEIEGCLNSVCATSDTTLDDNQWHHIVFRMDDIADEVALFVDGVKQADTDLYTGQADNSNPFVIGQTGNPSGSSLMSSSLDEVAIWTRALTDSEISNLQKLRSGTWYWKANATDSDGNTGENKTFQFSVDTSFPLINSSINDTTPRRFNRVNLSANVSDNSGLSFCQFIHNGTVGGAQVYENVSISGTVDSCHQVFDVNLSRDNVINFTILVNDTFNNKNQTEIIITVENTPPPFPTLVSPIDNNHTFNRTPTFAWSNVTDADNDTLIFNLRLLCELCSQDNRDVNTTELNHTVSALQFLGDDGFFYNWSVRVYDNASSGITGQGEYSETRNITIDALVSIRMLTNSVSFGTMNLDDVDNTTNDSPPPFSMENDGNTNANISIWAADDMFDSSPNPTNDFMWKIGNTSEVPSFSHQSENVSIVFRNFTTTSADAVFTIPELDYRDDNDSAEIEIFVHIPNGEPPGAKSSRVVLEAKRS